MERFLQRDGVVRVLSIVLAIILWAQISGAQSVEGTRTLNVRLEQVNRAPDIEIMPAPAMPAEVRVTLRGPRRLLDRVQPAQLSAWVDLQGLILTGPVTIPVKVSGLPEGVTPVSLDPPAVTLVLERLVSKTLPASLADTERIVGDVRYTWDWVSPPQVRVTGRERLVAAVQRVEGRVDLSQVQQGGEVQVALRALASDGAEVQGVTLSPATAPVKVSVQRLPPAREVPVRPKFVGSLPPGYTFSVTVDPAVVKVRGPAERHKEWTEVATEPIPLTGQRAPFTVQVGLVPPPGAVRLDQDRVTVAVQVAEVREERTLRDVPLEVWHLAANLEARPSVPAVSVRLLGPKRILDALDPTRLAAHLEAQDLGPGRHQVPVRINRPEGVEVLGIDPPAVELVITEKKAP